MSMLNISKSYNVGVNPIRNILKRNGIKIRSIIEDKIVNPKIKKINQFSKDGVFVKSYNSISELSKKINKKEHAIRSYFSKTNVCWGYKWEIEYN